METIAQIINPVTDPGLGSLNGISFFQGFLPALISLGFIIGVTAFLIMLILGAIQWITSSGDKGAVEAARSRVTNAVVGLFILLALFAIVNLVEIFFGTEILHFNIDVLRITGGSGSPPSGPGPGPGPVVINANCPCSAPLGGGCATTSTIAVGPGSECFRCTISGWDGPIGGSCSPVSCSSCP